VPFEVSVANVEEAPLHAEEPADCALRLAKEKRNAVMEQHPESAVVAADTVVSLGNTVLEKPRDPEDAMAILRSLSGCVHTVHTAVAVGGPRLKIERVVTAQVGFRALSDAEIDAYVASGEPMDKAGAYGIQGDGGALVDHVHGSYTAIVGLPLRETLELLRLVGVLP
jgi:septum formation protein